MDKLGADKEEAITVRSMIPRLLKASVKTIIAYLFFMLISQLMAPLEGIYSYQATFTIFFALYLAFIFLIELTKGTVYQHLFSITNSLIFVAYFAYILNTSIITFSIEQVSLLVDLRFFFYIFVLGGILGFAKSILQFLSWVNDREERWLILQTKSL
jgi:hypothetical protein